MILDVLRFAAAWLLVPLMLLAILAERWTWQRGEQQREQDRQAFAAEQRSLLRR